MTNSQPLSREERLRRVLLLCVYFARNMAFYRAAWGENGLITPAGSNFWNTVNANFIDTAVLEWCKLFADKNGHQSWRKVVGDADKFEAKMLSAANLDAKKFEDMIKHVRAYRDKFVAHLDSEREMKIPQLDLLLAVVRVLFKHLLEEEMQPEEAARVGIRDIDELYWQSFNEAKAIYSPA